MKNRVLLFSVFLFFAIFTLPHSSFSPSNDDLESRFIKALEGKDEAELILLVKTYRYKTYAYTIDLLNQSLLTELSGDTAAAQARKKRIKKLAGIYNDVYDSDCLKKRLALHEKWSWADKKQKLRADSLKALGLEFYERTDFQRTIEYWSRSLEMYRKIGDQRGEGSVLYKMGVVHSRLGQRREATRYSQEALQIERAIDNRIGEAYLYTTAFFYSRIGRYDTAIELYEHSLRVVREIGDLWQERRALNFLAWNHFLLKDYETAKAKLEKGLDIGRRTGHQRGESISLCDIGLMYRHMGHYDLALECYNQAVEIDRDIGHRFGILSDLIGLGEVYTELGHYTQALRAFREGLRHALEIRSLDFIWKAQWSIGSVLEKLNEDDDALDFYQQSIRTIESIRNQLEVDAFKTYFFIENPPVYKSIIGLLTKMGRYVEAFEYVERSKAQTLLEVLAGRDPSLNEMIDPDLLETRKTVEKRIETLNRRLVQDSPEIIDDKKGIGLNDSLKMVRIEHQDLLRQIELNRTAYKKSSGSSRTLTLRDIQQRVLSSEDRPILVEYLVDNDCTHVWVVGQNTLDYYTIEIKENELKDMIHELRQPFLDLRQKKIYTLTNLPYNLKLAHELYTLLFQPIETYLRECDHVIIVPDNILHTVPFGALVTEIDSTKSENDLFFSRYERARYLIEKYSMSYAHSGSVLDPISRKPKNENRITGQLLAFGAPGFGASEGEWGFEPLPATEYEVEGISEVLGSSVCEIHLGKSAREGLLKTKAGQFNYLHLATHSVLEDSDPLYSKIVFALDDDPQEDGFLETYEIFDLNLNAELVVLSSCETGLGKLSRGEGLIGLTRAFMYAGAPSVLASLWSVGNPTTKLMTSLYQNMTAGKTKAEALRQAQIKILHSRDAAMSYAHPFFWAPFVLVGDWR